MMAVRYIINYTMARKESSQAAIKFLNKVIRDIRLDARFRAASGPFRTGRLAASIQHRGPTIQGTKVVASVGSKLKYAASVEAGADIHPISARGDHTLKFFWHKRGYWATPPSVIHPGQRGKEYLRGPMKRAALKFGMHYITYSRNIP